MEKIQCCHCGKFVLKSKKHKKHDYCSNPACQRARKAEWQRHKIRTDKDYELNQRSCNEKWKKENPGYWKEYRQRKPEKNKRNRDLQSIRNRRQSIKKRGNLNINGIKIAKMDALNTTKLKLNGEFLLVPTIAKMDALKVYLLEISRSYV